MNATTNPIASTWKRNGQHFAMTIAGLLIAASGLAGVLTTQEGQPHSAGPRARTFVAAAPAQAVSVNPMTMSYVVVRSEEDAIALEREAAALDAMPSSAGQTSVWARLHVLVADSPEASARIDEMLSVASGDLMAAGLALEVIDARVR